MSANGEPTPPAELLPGSGADSRAKVAAYLRFQAEHSEDPMIQATVALLPQVLARLPEDPVQLDAQLLDYAQLLLFLRSDDAPGMELTECSP